MLSGLAGGPRRNRGAVPAIVAGRLELDRRRGGDPAPCYTRRQGFNPAVSVAWREATSVATTTHPLYTPAPAPDLREYDAMDEDKRNEDNDERPRIKVTDRRKFTADGSPRDADPDPDSADAAAESPPAEIPIVGEESEPASRPAATAPEAAAPATPPDASVGPDPSEPGAAPGADQRPRIADLPRDFTAFVEGMYLEAMLYLGAIPDPRTGEVAEDLDMAKYKIDLLGLLQQKTEGNLTPDEAQQLEEVLYQVRMFYVQKTGKKPSP